MWPFRKTVLVTIPDPVILNKAERMVKASEEPLKKLSKMGNRNFGVEQRGRPLSTAFKVSRGTIDFTLHCVQNGGLYDYHLGATWGRGAFEETCEEITPLIHITFHNKEEINHHGGRAYSCNKTPQTYHTYGVDDRIDNLIVAGLTAMYEEYDRLVEVEAVTRREAYRVAAIKEDARLLVSNRILDEMNDHVLKGYIR